MSHKKARISTEKLPNITVIDIRTIIKLINETNITNYTRDSNLIATLGILFSFIISFLSEIYLGVGKNRLLTNIWCHRFFHQCHIQVCFPEYNQFHKDLAV
jgi:hypothetical protein